MMLNEMKLPANCTVLQENEMEYLYGGSVDTPENLWDIIVNASKAVTYFSRMLLSLASVVTNINTAIKMKDSLVEIMKPEYFTLP